MAAAPSPELNEEIERALEELRSLILGRYPEATFDLSMGDDPEGVYLTAIVDVEDSNQVMDVYIDRLIDMEDEEGLPVYVIPVRPLERVLEEMQRR
ncbi:MAG: hypothetical protein GEU73_13990 [Chloroflexi bacterium]|nr:hypothetical protein [Chloroflexota bacterium]